MKEWWGPKGCTIVASHMDLRVGGTYLGAMRDPTGRVYVGEVRLSGNRGAEASQVGAFVLRRSRRVDAAPVDRPGRSKC